MDSVFHSFYYLQCFRYLDIQMMRAFLFENIIFYHFGCFFIKIIYNVSIPHRGMGGIL